MSDGIFVYFCFAIPLSSSPFFRSVHCRLLPVKYRFYLTSFYWIKRLLNTPAKYFFMFLYWIKTRLFSTTAKYQFSFMIIIFGVNLYHKTWQNPRDFGTLFVIVIVMYLFLYFCFFCINLDNYYLTRPNLCKLGEVVEKGEQNDGKNVHPTTKQLEMIWSFLFCNQDHPL